MPEGKFKVLKRFNYKGYRVLPEVDPVLRMEIEEARDLVLAGMLEPLEEYPGMAPAQRRRSRQRPEDPPEAGMPLPGARGRAYRERHRGTAVLEPSEPETFELGELESIHSETKRVRK